MAKKVKPKKKNRDKFILCDPAVCDHCMYIGEGDFICDKKGHGGGSFCHVRLGGYR